MLLTSHDSALKGGVGFQELSGALKHNAETIVRTLHETPSLKHMSQLIHDEIDLTMQLVLDEIEDVYHHLGDPGTAFREDDVRCANFALQWDEKLKN